MIPTRGQIGNGVRVLLGDTAQTGGGLYTDDFQVIPLNMSYQEMFSRLSVAGADRVQREGYYVLPAYTMALSPATAGLTNFGFAEEVWERAIVATYAIAAITPNSPSAGLCSITLSTPLPASAVTGVQLEVYNASGMSDDINDQWAVTVTDTTHIILNGCTATGTYTNSGIVVYSTEQWQGPLTPQDDTDSFPQGSPSSALGIYSWQKGIFKFPVCSTSRELKFEYLLSSGLSLTTPSTASDSMGVDDSYNFLINRTAQYCAQSKVPSKVPELKNSADYFLGVMLSGAARAMQADEPIIPARFRRQRNSRYPIG